MQFHLVLPGLGWATARSAALPALPLPRRAAGPRPPRWLPPSAPGTWLAARFGWTDARLPCASLRRAGGVSTRADAHWLYVDPVHLHFATANTCSWPTPGLRPSPATNPMRSSPGSTTPSPTSRPLRGAQPPTLVRRRPNELRLFFHPSPTSIAARCSSSCPGERHRPLGRLANEIEVWLYNHPVNAAREAAGQRTINGVWLWAPAPDPPAAPAHRVQADALFARGPRRRGRTEPTDRYPDGTGFAGRRAASSAGPASEPHRRLAGLEALGSDWFAPLAALRPQVAGCIAPATHSLCRSTVEAAAFGSSGAPDALLATARRKPNPLTRILPPPRPSM